MGLKTIALLLLLSTLAVGEVKYKDMQREARWLRMSAEKLYTFTPAPFGPDWQNTQSDRDSFMNMARRFERSWDDREATVENTTKDYQRVRKSFDKIKLFARLNMNAAEVDNIEFALRRLDVIYGINPKKEDAP